MVLEQTKDEKRFSKILKRLEAQRSEHINAWIGLYFGDTVVVDGDVTAKQLRLIADALDEAEQGG